MRESFIAVSKLAPNYENWLRKIDSSVVIVDLYGMETQEAVKRTGDASGLLLTGGSDIHPSRYGRNEFLPFCRNIDEKRDELELAVIEEAFEKKPER